MGDLPLIPGETRNEGYLHRHLPGVHQLSRVGLPAAMATVIVTAVALLAFQFNPDSASARGWKSPSGNIVCGTASSKVVCFLLEQDFADAPCDGVYSTTGSVGRRGGARLFTGCFGGMPMNYSPPIRTVRYGGKFRVKGVTCRSMRTGMRCSNRSGHGFKLRRARAVRF